MGGEGEGRAGAGVSLIPDIPISMCVVQECHGWQTTGTTII